MRRRLTPTSMMGMFSRLGVAQQKSKKSKIGTPDLASAQQSTDFSIRLSDHRAVTWDKTHSWNVMMQARGGNTGFGQKCGLVQITVDPQTILFEDIAGAQLKENILIRFGDTLFYADQETQMVSKIEITESNRHAYHQLLSKITNAYRSADKDERILINAITNRMHAHLESDEIYSHRIKNVLENLRDYLIAHPEIGMVALQEAPTKKQLEIAQRFINELFPEEWKLTNPDITFDATDWGIMTLINRARFEASHIEQDHSITANIGIKDIQIRCRTFAMFRSDGTVKKVTNLHLPHSATPPGKSPTQTITEQAFIAVVTNVIRELIEKGVTKEITHDLVGDWNIEPEHMNLLLEKITLEQIKLSKDKPAFSLSAQLYSSPQGHIKLDKSKLSVDALLSISVTPAEEYMFTFNHSWMGSAFASTTVVLASSLLVGIAAFDEEQKLEVEEEESQKMSSLFRFG